MLNQKANLLKKPKGLTKEIVCPLLIIICDTSKLNYHSRKPVLSTAVISRITLQGTLAAITYLEYLCSQHSQNHN